MRAQTISYVLLSVVPFMLLISPLLKGTGLKVVAVVLALGAIGIFSLEIMAMKVQGIRNYFRDKWNYLDCVMFILNLLLVFLIFYLGDEEFYDPSSSNMRNYLKLLKFILVILIWMKITWL